MLSASSPFIDSSISIYHNAIKALIFGAAQFLLAFSVFKSFSLFAARGNLFSSYLMFMEDPVQKVYYLASKGFSQGTFLVLGFTIVYTAASLYGTLLWGLDAPGYIMRSQSVAASKLSKSLLEKPGYISYLDIWPNKLGTLEKELPTIIGANIYKPGVNFSLTTDVDRGRAEYISPINPGVGGRIWLDSDGLSVTTDTNVGTAFLAPVDGNLTGPTSCLLQFINPSEIPAQFFNCTFNNTYAQSLLLTQLGQPEIHWDTPSDAKGDSKYLKPDRKRNIWAVFGSGGGTAMMKQVFTVTKGLRRHTFIETSTRFTLLNKPGIPFALAEVDDFLKRTWSTNTTERETPQPLLTRLLARIMKVQDLEQSYNYGIIDATNTTATQVLWQFLTPEVDQVAQFSIIRISVTNITLIRSETLQTPSLPLRPCDTTFMNIAYGGVVDDTDCATAKADQQSQFFGKVDTAAVLIVYGLGDGRSNLSSMAVDEGALQWTSNHSETIDDLLVARGFIASVDPSLVTLNISILQPAISYLQIFLVLLSVIFAAISYSSLRLLSSSHWSNSLLANVLGPAEEPNSNQDPGYIKKFPEIRLQRAGAAQVITINDSMFKLERVDTDPLVFNDGTMKEKGPVSSQANEVVAEGQSFLIHRHK